MLESESSIGTEIEIERESRIVVTRFQKLTVEKMVDFLDTVPNDAELEFKVSPGGGTQLDPGGTIYIRAKWTEKL